MPPVLPWNTAVPNENTPPSRATAQYPCVPTGGGGPAGPEKATTLRSAATITNPSTAVGDVNRRADPTPAWNRMWPSFGSSAYSVAAVVLMTHTAPPATIGGPLALLGPCQAIENDGAAVSRRRARMPSSHAA